MNTPKTSMIAEQHVVGVDLGQSRDPTAICVVALNRPVDEPHRPILRVVFLERLRLGMSYPHMVARVEEVVSKLPPGTELVIDMSGVGRAVYDLFVVARPMMIDEDGNVRPPRRLSPIGVTITAGREETRNGRIYCVPKLDLVSKVQALLHDGRLKISRQLPEAGVLVRELKEFRVDYTTAGHVVFNARVGAHDDLVLALALAVWRASRPKIIITQQTIDRLSVPKNWRGVRHLAPFGF